MLQALPEYIGLERKWLTSDYQFSWFAKRGSAVWNTNMSNKLFLTVDECSEENAPSEKSGIPKKRKRGRPRKEQGN